jgi:dipeptidyl aminopeptidase/acylaminoacyl peptidase
MVAVWSPDGGRIVFASARDAPPFLHIKDVTGGVTEALLPSQGTLQSPDDWSPDGRYLLYSDRHPDTRWDLWILPLDGSADPIPFLRTPFSELTASFSPDGTWVAYASDESGRTEVYVTTFPEPGEKHRISTGGGYLPEWRGDGNELFYLALDNWLMAVPVDRNAGFEPRTPTPLFSVEPYKNAFLPYDVLPDGERFIVISALPGEATTPTVVTGWQESVPR